MQRYVRYFNVFVFDESIEVRRYLIDYFRKNQSGQISHLWAIKIHSIVSIRDLERRIKRFTPHCFIVREDIEANDLLTIEQAIAKAYRELSLEIIKINCPKPEPALAV